MLVSFSLPNKINGFLKVSPFVVTSNPSLGLPNVLSAATAEATIEADQFTAVPDKCITETDKFIAGPDKYITSDYSLS